jgi:hypothetical protein
MSYLDDTKYAIGITPQLLIPLRKMVVPVPDQVYGDTATEYYTRGDLSRTGDGPAWVVWVWDVLGFASSSKILSFLNGADSVRVYVRTDIPNAQNGLPRNNFDVYYGWMYKPIIDGNEGSRVARSPYAYQSIKVQFMELVLQPGYI